jgi:sugar phosphate isomerase/epimerase
LHYGAEVYVVKLGSALGLSRSERMARLEAVATMVRDLSRAARTRGMTLALELDSHCDSDALEVLSDLVRSEKAGFLFSPSRMLCLGQDPEPIRKYCNDLIIGSDLTDRGATDLEPRLPGRGVLKEHSIVPELTQFPNLRFHTAEIPAQTNTDAVIESLNNLVRPMQSKELLAQEPSAPGALL